MTRSCWLSVALLIVIAALASGCSSSELADMPTPAFPTSPGLPTPDFSLLVPTAGPLCDAALQAEPAPHGLNRAPFGLFYLTNTSYETGSWVPFRTEDYPQAGFPPRAQSADQVQALVCILVHRASTGRYSDGTTAYSLTWDVRVAGYPGGAVLASQSSMSGEPPPETKYGAGDAYGYPPLLAANTWLRAIMQMPSVELDFRTIVDILFSPDGTLLVITGGDSSSGSLGRVTVWDLATGQELKTFVQDIPRAARFLPDSRTISTASVRRASLWDVATGTERPHDYCCTEYPRKGVGDAAISSDGSVLAVKALGYTSSNSQYDKRGIMEAI